MRTRYEVELVTRKGRRIVGYTARRTREALMGYARTHGDEILSLVGDGDVWLKLSSDALKINGVVTIRFTGRTERDARSELDREARAV